LATGVFALPESVFRRLAQKAPHDPGTILRLATVLKGQQRWKEAAAMYARAFALTKGETKESWYLHRALCLEKSKAGESAALVLRESVSLYSYSQRSCERLYRNLKQRHRWWELAEFLPRYLALRQDAEVYADLGSACRRMGRHVDAAQAFINAAERNRDNSVLFFRAACAFASAADEENSRIWYDRAVTSDRNGESRRFGQGAFFQRIGLWEQAAEQYALQAENYPQDAELLHRLGAAYERICRWEKASAAYERALDIQNVPELQYRLGYVQEKLERLQDAVRSYKAVIAAQPEHTEAAYRSGYVLTRSKKYEDACTVFLTLPQGKISFRETRAADALELEIRSDSGNASLYKALGDVYAARSDWNRAADAYRAAVARSNEHRPDWQYALGLSLTRAERFAEACAAFIDIRLLVRPYDTPKKADPKRWRQEVYTEFLEMRPILPKTILYEASEGNLIGCNPYALCIHLLGRADFSDYTHVWSIGDPANDIPEALKNHPAVIFVSRHSLLYLRYLATAAFLVNNATFPSYFLRRPEQRYLNTWHGTPLKVLGKDIPAPFMTSRNAARNFLHVTHMISPNALTGRVLIERYDIDGLYPGELAETGYPRIDRLFGMTQEEKATLRARLGAAAGEPLILYAPTWRGLYSKPRLEQKRLLRDLKELASLPGKVVFRGHQRIARAVGKLSLPMTMAGLEIDAMDLLAVADLLITDYSSIYFDFLPTKRPVLFYVYDLEEYRCERGLYLSPEKLPGRLCRNMAELKAAALNHLSGDFTPNAAYLEALREFCPHEDGHSTERAVSFFFASEKNDDTAPQQIPDGGPVLFYAGSFTPNGITTSFLNLTEELSGTGLLCALAVDPNAMEVDPDRMSKFSQLSAGIQVLARCGAMLMTPEERQLNDMRDVAFEEGAYPEEFERSLRRAFQREFVRMFGYARFGAVINFDGYSRFWVELFSSAAVPFKAIYLHTDMAAERTARFPQLQRIFHLYREHDALVTVSTASCEKNRENLSRPYRISPDKFLVCRNLLNPKLVGARAGEDMDSDIAAWLGDRRFILFMGRLSPEKGPDRLVSAFAHLCYEHPEARLVICGDGALRAALRERIADLRLEANILLAGRRDNPFPLLARTDCLVMSSRHEGQPMVLLEAMLLRRPVVAVDIPAVRDAVGDYGRLVENSEQGLLDGMREAFRGNILAGVFDADAYQREALGTFISLSGRVA
jgi:CDP-glycerol glycerophosphotransferase